MTDAKKKKNISKLMSKEECQGFSLNDKLE